MKLPDADIPKTFVLCDQLIDKLKAEKDGAVVTEAMIDELRALGYKGGPPLTKADYLLIMDRCKTQVRSGNALCR